MILQGLVIGLMFLKNQIVYIQFHPVVYIVKLNIEMSMASLVVRLAQGRPENDMYPEEKFQSSSHKGRSELRSGHHTHIKSVQLKSKRAGNTVLSANDSDESLGGIHCQTDLNVVSELVDQKKGAPSSRSSHETPHSMFGDDIPLHKNSANAHAHEV
jgi:hypothetical protein